MLKTKSRDGVYLISAPDDAKTDYSELCDDETKYDTIQDVYLEVVEGQEGNLCNLARAIAYDCFSFDSTGLHLLAKKLRCHVKSGKNNHEYTVEWYNNFDYIIKSLAFETKL